MMDKIIMNSLDEIIYHETLENGLNVYIYKKEGFNKKSAYFVTKYGSNNNEFVPIGEDKIRSFPRGIAHFLEHKLFESSDNENTFTKFEKYGAYVNAYTNHFETCYYFTTSNYFNECLNLLLDFVQSPYFTDENVEKEKGIINQEIDMTNDRIEGFLYEKVFENTLHENPNRYRTIGDKKSVSEITKEDLYTCYNTFYNPSNMILCISGDIDVDKTIDEIKKNQALKNFNKQEEIKMPTYSEKEEVVKEYEHFTKNVMVPRVSVCYKIKVPKLTGKEDFKRRCLYSLFIEMKFGSTSNFNNYLMENEIINSGFSFNYCLFDDTLLFMFSALIIDKDKFILEIDKKIKELDYDEKIFDLHKKAYLASVVRAFEKPSVIASRIYSDIITYKEFTNYAYDEYLKLTFNDFIDEVKKLKYDNKSIIYITKKENSDAKGK